MYGYGRDRNMRPIMFMNVRGWLDSGVSVDTLMNMVDVLFTYTLENAIVPGQIETWHMIIDFDGVGLTELPIGSLAMFAQRQRRNYYVRNQSITAINVPLMVKIAANFLFSLVDEF